MHKNNDYEQQKDSFIHPQKNPITARRHEVKADQLAPHISIPFPRKTYSPQKSSTKKKKSFKEAQQVNHQFQKARSRGCPATYAPVCPRTPERRDKKRDQRTQLKPACYAKTRNEAKRKNQDNKIKTPNSDLHSSSSLPSNPSIIARLGFLPAP